MVSIGELKKHHSNATPTPLLVQTELIDLDKVNHHILTNIVLKNITNPPFLLSCIPHPPPLGITKNI